MKQLVIMPGGFHPFHAGHLALYQSAEQAFPGADIKVAATNDTSGRPFPFALKEKLAQLAGVPPGNFYQVNSPFRAEEITKSYDPDTTQLIFVRSEKDQGKSPMPAAVDPATGQLPLVTRGANKGKPVSNYLQYYSGNQDQPAPMTQHAYMAYLPTVEFGPGMTSATEIRSAWPTLNEKRKTALVMSLYPATQSNPKLADTVVKMLDTAMGTQEVDEDLSRRGFLKGAGAAAVAGAAGGAEAGWFSSPKLFADGAYSGSVMHYSAAYSDTGAVGNAVKDYDITVKIIGNNIAMHVHGRGPINKLSSSMPSDFEFSNFTKTPDGILAKKTKSKKTIKHHGYELPPGKTYGDTIDPNVKMIPINPKEYTDTWTEILEIKQDGSLKFRKITEQSPAEKGYRYNVWGYNGYVKSTGKGLNESVNQGVTEGIEDNYNKNDAGIKAALQAGVKLIPVQSNNDATGKPIYIHDNSGRYTVAVDMGGISVPFYNSTGQGGKASVAVDKWYPFFGIGPDGWINKGSEEIINDFYGSNKLKRVAQVLDNTLGLPSRAKNVSGWSVNRGDGNYFISAVNRGLDPAARSDRSTKLRDNMLSVLRGLGEPNKYVEKHTSRPKAYAFDKNNPEHVAAFDATSNSEREIAMALAKDLKSQGVAEAGKRFVDPELARTKQYAKQHYPGMADPESAFDKWVTRSLMHSDRDDHDQDKRLQQLAKEITAMKTKIQDLQQNADYLDESR